jgi:4-amino-4-deoxy-L-arabinose transferase-like glycosyltransferase
MPNFAFALQPHGLSGPSNSVNNSDDVSPKDGNHTQSVNRRRNFYLLLAVFGLTAVVQIAVAGRSGLWADEIFSLAMATGHSLEHPAAAADPAWGDFVEFDHPVHAEELQRYLKHDRPPASPTRVIRAVLLSDTSPPLYYLLLYGWTLLFGTSDLVLRSFSIGCSLACLPFLVGVARRTGGKGAVFPACVLFAFSPLGIYYSTEGRMYSLLWLCMLAMIWASLALRQRGGGFALDVMWVVASVAGFLTHYFFVFPWLAIVVFLLLRPGKFQRRSLLICIFLVALASLPWYLMVPDSLGRWRVTQGWLKSKPPNFDRVRDTWSNFSQFFSGDSVLWGSWLRSTTTAGTAALALFAVVAVAMAWRLRSRMFHGCRVFLWLWFIAACAAPLAFDLAQHTYMVAVPRYAIAALPAAYLLAAVGLACLGRRTKLIMLALIVLAWAPNLLSIYGNRSRNWQPIRQLSRAANADGTPSDLILVHSIPSGVLGISRYANESAALASWVGQLGTRRVPESIHKLAAGRTRIVFVKVHAVREPAPEEQWLRANAVVFHETRLNWGRIVDFRPMDSKTF